MVKEGGGRRWMDGWVDDDLDAPFMNSILMCLVYSIATI